MDEEKEAQGQAGGQELPDQMLNKAGNMLGGTAKQVGKKATKEGFKKLAKKIAELIAKNPKLAAIILLVIIALVVVFSLILPAIDSYLDDLNAQTTDDVAYQLVKEYCTIDENGIRIDKEKFLQNIVAELSLNGIDLNELGFGDDGDYVVGIENTITGEKNVLTNTVKPDTQAAKYLFKFLAASLTGEFPYIEGSDEEVQGIIHVKRRKDENTDPIDLIYMGYEKFQEMLKTEDNLQKEELLKYFSLDENWNLCIAKPYRKVVNKYDHGNLVSSEGEFTISEVKIPYRDMIAQYTTPFLFLINLQITTHNPDYVEAVSELMSKQSEIEFMIFDQITTKKDIYNYKATRHAWSLQDIGTTGETGVVGGPHQKEWKLGESDIDETTETIVETDTIKANVTKAKTWIIEQETNYEMQVTKEYPYGPNGTTNTLPDENEIINPPGSWDTGRSEYLFTEIITREWVKSGDTQTKILPSEFMGLWSNETGTYVKGAPYLPNGENASGEKLPGKIVAYKLLGSSQPDHPIINIVTSTEDLYDRLEQNVATQKHAELMREMIRIYLNGEFLDESTFKNSAFISMYEPDEYIGGTYSGDFDVHDESLFITDLETLKKALAGGYSQSDKLVENAQAFLDMQEKYKVNALFAASVSITETSGGRKGHAVDGCNNWFNITTKNTNKCHTTVSKKGTVYHWRIFDTIKEGIDAFGWNIAEGSHYYTQGRYTVGDIGQKYCPNTAEHPTQAEDWTEATLAQISRFYEAVGIDISPYISGSGGSAGSWGSSMGGVAGDLKDLFPNGIPTTEAEMQAYLTTITIEINDASGKRTTRKLTVHKAVAEDVKQIFADIQRSGFKIKSVGAYSWRNMAGGTSRSHHSYGVAIDINPDDNCMIKNGQIIAGSSWDPVNNEFSIASNGPVVLAFAKRGWTWGGSWKSSKDYMHFSLTGH